MMVEFENVPVERIDEVIPKMDEVLKNIVDDGPEKFDLERITNFIHLEAKLQRILFEQKLCAIETHGQTRHKMFVGAVLPLFLK